MTVATKEGIQKYDIMACPKAIDLAMDSVKYEDFPFDIDIVIPNTEWVVCYDTTDFPEQIRYVNWTNEAVYVNLEDLVPDENFTELEEDTILSSQTPMDNVETSVPVTTDSDDTKSMICQGTCGDNVEYLQYADVNSGNVSCGLGKMYLKDAVLWYILVCLKQ